jgi:hypothetical protein
MKSYIIYTITSVLLGFILGIILLFLWFIFRLAILGYGDSGPSWVNTISEILFWSGFIIGILGGQLLFVFKKPFDSFIEKKVQKRKTS